LARIIARNEIYPKKITCKRMSTSKFCLPDPTSQLSSKRAAWKKLFTPSSRDLENRKFQIQYLITWKFSITCFLVFSVHDVSATHWVADETEKAKGQSEQNRSQYWISHPHVHECSLALKVAPIKSHKPRVAAQFLSNNLSKKLAHFQVIKNSQVQIRQQSSQGTGRQPQ